MMIHSIEDIQDIIDDGYNDPRSVVDTILYQSNLGTYIIEHLLQDEDSNFINNVKPKDIEEQVASTLKTQLVNYYTENWEEFSTK